MAKARWWAASALVLAFAGPMAAQDELREKLAGVWGVEMTSGPLVKGELRIDGRDGSWRALIGGWSAPAERSGTMVHLALPAESGEFRGHLAPGGEAILGHWIQPAGVNPYTSRYASPVRLAKVAPNVWRGTVTPLEQKISFYVQISNSGDGLSAFVRNPEANYFAGRVFQVVVEGNAVMFKRDGRTDLSGTFDAASDSLRIGLLNSYPPLKLTRRKEGEAPGFNARAGEEAHRYVYRPPASSGDGWAVGTLEDAGSTHGR